MEEVSNNNDELGQDRIRNGGCSSNSRCNNISGTYGGPYIEPISTRKSNLKKTTTVDDHDQENRLKTAERRKVSWPDAHGKDIAHVHEFEPSVSEDGGELDGVRNSCVCAIQ